MIPVADPFMADAPVRRPGDFYRTVKGVPLVADPNGTLTKPKNKKDPGHVKRVMYRRPSGFGKQIENTYNLQKWGERQEALGFALDFNILKRASALLDGDRDSKEWKDEADSVVVAAKNAARAWIAAERGTHTHGLAEDDDTDIDIIARIEHGETLGLDRTVQVALVEVWRGMLERNGLEIVAVEFACVNDHYKAAGTGDRVARLTRSLRFTLITGELVELPAGTYVILDIKTGQLRLASNGTPMYWQSYAVQVALYAPPGAQLYDPDTDERTPFPWPVSEDWALIAHLDVLGALDGTPSCELVLVDLAAGRRAADLCVAARDWENEATVFSVAQIVEGEEGCAQAEPSPSTPVSPQGLPAAVNAGEAGSADPTRPPAVDVDHDNWTPTSGQQNSHPITNSETITSALAWASQPAPTPLPALPANPDEGKPDYLFDVLEVKYNNLDAAAKVWIKTLIMQAQQAGVSFHAGNHHTERRYWIINGLVTWAATLNVALDFDILRALCVAALDNDAPLDPRHTPGACVGSLGATEAQRFSELVDDYVGTSV